MQADVTVQFIVILVVADFIAIAPLENTQQLIDEAKQTDLHHPDATKKYQTS